MAVHTSEGLTRISKAELASQSEDWGARARGLSIVNAASCVNASHLLKSVKLLRSEIQKWFEPHIEAAMETKRKADAARKALVDEKDRMEAPLVDAEAVIKRALLAWETEQERLRQEQERALQAEAQRQAEAVTLAAAAAMELEANATGDAGMLEEAQAIFDAPTEAPVVVVQTFMPKVAGVTYRDAWKAHPDVDIKALAAAVAAGQAPVAFLTPNMTAINQFARATQGAQPVAGVRMWNDRQIAARG
jgi:murein DD-endopeptidase MepM/ murein hydrolase activator NlpD